MGYYGVTFISENNYLAHHGIKGQKWGIRRFQNTDGSLTPEGKERYTDGSDDANGKKDLSGLETIRATAKDGTELVMSQRPAPKLAQFIGKYLPSVKKNIENGKQFNIMANGKRVGDADIFDEGNNSLNVVWITVDDSQRGKGYATAAMKGFVDYAKKKGYSRMTLEVPGDSPDARHIYEKLGFKAIQQITDDDDAWGGLTKMHLKLDGDERKDELKHFGIKGQKWGTRRFQNEDGTYTPEGKERYGQGGKDGRTGSIRAPSPMEIEIADQIAKRTKYAVRKHNTLKEIEKSEINRDKERVTKDNIEWMAKNCNKKERKQIIQRMKDHPKMSFHKAAQPVEDAQVKRMLRNAAVFMTASIALPVAVAYTFNNRQKISDNLHKADNAVKTNKTFQSFMKSIKHRKMKDAVVLRRNEYEIDKRHGLPSGRR